MTLDSLSLSLFSCPLSPHTHLPTLSYHHLTDIPSKRQKSTPSNPLITPSESPTSPNVSKHISELSYHFHSRSQSDHATLLPYRFNFNRTQTRYYVTWRALRTLSGWEGAPPSLAKSLCPEKQDLVRSSSLMMAAMFRVSLDTKPLLSTRSVQHHKWCSECNFKILYDGMQDNLAPRPMKAWTAQQQA